LILRSRDAMPIPDPLRALPIAVALLLLFPLARAQEEGFEPLFDGESLAGWDALEEDAAWWGVAGGAIRGGSLEEPVPRNTFLVSKRSFQNFELRLSIRLEGSGGLVNSGIQIRSTRVEGSHEMRGYQVDVGEGWWGKLYDESRRNRVIGEPVDPEALAAAVRPEGWNDYRILAEGPRIRSWINGVAALDYTEVEGGLPLDGQIGIQVHGGHHVRVELRDPRVRVLPDTPGAMTWRRHDQLASVAGQGQAPVRSAAEEQAGFHLLEGFEVELVTSDPLVDKVVDVAFDDAGRMWAITAVEYPIDANETEGVAELYAAGGRDRVLVFDDVWREGPHEPRVFADGLFIPMAILPRSEDVLLGMGPDILRLADEDGDGRADSREVVLTGFGIQDSHLLPHRFVRAPGGWVYLAQGAFNSSLVRTKEGVEVSFDKCKLGRFQSDGSSFEVVGIGLNNIWGFVLDRRGDKWIQEANDLGFPLVPFEHGRSYPGIGMDRFHPHSPWHPSYADFSMGGSGLSGLALSEDDPGFPAPWNETFFLANPIISAIQAIHATRDEAEPGRVVLERKRDLLTSEDTNFRPVAIHFGPDGCLYVVDWYNPIISHNEVPRDHPSRDRESSRIWRIRHASQARRAPVDVSAAEDDELVELLRSGSTWTARAAWHQIGERGLTRLAAPLEALARDEGARVRERVLALWCLQDLDAVAPALLDELAGGESYALRREAARLFAELRLPSDVLARHLAWSPDDPDPRVRQAALESLARSPELGPAAVALILRFVHPLPDGPWMQLAQDGARTLSGPAAELAFERSLARAVLEARPAAVFALLDSELVARSSPERRRFALLGAGGAEGARRLAAWLAAEGAAPSEEELPFLAAHAGEPDVRRAVATWIAAPASRAEGLDMLAGAEERWEEGPLRAEVVRGLRALRAERPGVESDALLLRLARERRLVELEPEVVALLDGGGDTLDCLRALVELDSRDALLFHELASASLPETELRRLAVGALAGVDTPAAFELLLELWPVLGKGSKDAALMALVESADGARRLVAALDRDDVELAVLGPRLDARLTEQLGDDDTLTSLRARAAGSARPVLRLDGGREDFADTQLVIDGPFTIEAWVRLDPGITNGDGLLHGPGGFDLNFHDARLRLWLGPLGDVIIARRRVTAGRWNHFALTRAEDGRLSLYLNGELDESATPEMPVRYEELAVGRTGPEAGTAGELCELRFWSVARSASQVGASFRLPLEDGAAHPGLELVLPGDEVPLSGAARLERLLDGPPVLSAEEVAAEEATFNRYRALSGAPGNAARGREQFVLHCAPCHRVGGEGGDIGPVLDGAGSKGTEGLLRAILTPNAGVEAGYRTLIVRTTGGELLEGFLAAEDEASILLRRKDREDLRVPREEIESARFDRLSLMPEGLLEALSDDEARDLLHYLQGLR